MQENPIVSWLEQGDWGEDALRIQTLRAWEHYPLLLEAYHTLREEALFQSWIHGPAHIHRVLLLSALVCQGEGLEAEMVRQVLRAASYHDVGRTFDGYDIYHGARSALRLEELTGQTGENLVELQAAVTAHSRPDRDMESVVASFHPQNLPRALELTRLLKDGDNLDRVRLGDLDPRFLRHQSAKSLTDFAHRLFQRYPGEGNDGRPLFRPGGELCEK